LRAYRTLIVLLFLVFLPMPAVDAAPVDPLQVGDQGDEVLAIQEKLSQMGFVVGSMDGVYGDVTAEAVKMMQKEKNLPVDGKITPELFKTLVGRDLPVSRGAPVATVRRLLQSSFQHIGVPYWFGGTTPQGFDCSGFTRYVFANIGSICPVWRMDSSRWDDRCLSNDCNPAIWSFLKPTNRDRLMWGSI